MEYLRSNLTSLRSSKPLRLCRTNSRQELRFPYLQVSRKSIWMMASKSPKRLLTKIETWNLMSKKIFAVDQNYLTSLRNRSKSTRLKTAPILKLKRNQRCLIMLLKKVKKSNTIQTRLSLW